MSNKRRYYRNLGGLGDEYTVVIDAGRDKGWFFSKPQSSCGGTFCYHYANDYEGSEAMGARLSDSEAAVLILRGEICGSS